MLSPSRTTDFAAFLAELGSARLRAVALAWDKARGATAMPSFARLKPSSIAAQLPIVWIYHYDRATRQFTGRLAGDRIAHAFGKSFRGTPLEEVHPPQTLAMIQEQMERVVLTPACYRLGGKLFRKIGQTGMGERIMLPLADDGIHGDGVLGASDYDMPGVTAIDAPVELISEDARWFGLG